MANQHQTVSDSKGIRDRFNDWAVKMDELIERAVAESQAMTCDETETAVFEAPADIGREGCAS